MSMREFLTSTFFHELVPNKGISVFVGSMKHLTYSETEPTKSLLVCTNAMDCTDGVEVEKEGKIIGSFDRMALVDKSDLEAQDAEYALILDALWPPKKSKVVSNDLDESIF